MVTSILWSCALIATLVFGVMVYSIATFSAERGAAPANFRPRALIEVIWTLIPIAIFFAAISPAIRLIGGPDTRVAEAVYAVEISGGSVN